MRYSDREFNTQAFLEMLNMRVGLETDDRVLPDVKKMHRFDWFSEDHTISIITGKRKEPEDGGFITDISTTRLRDVMEALIAGGIDSIGLRLDGTGFHIDKPDGTPHDPKEGFPLELIKHVDGGWVLINIANCNPPVHTEDGEPTTEVVPP
jgi:hypothetical protein